MESESEENDVRRKYQKNKEVTQHQNHSIDRGWAWVVAFACMLNATTLIGYLVCNGILFVEFLDLFQASTTSTTLIFGVTSVIFALSSFITMQVLLPRFSIRQILSAGAILVSFGIVLSVFAQSITMLKCIQSIFIGTGQAMIMGPNLVAVSKYFKKRRAFAMAIANSGVSFAYILFPMLCRFLLDSYGLRGTLLIFTGIELHIIATSMLIRPLDNSPDKPVNMDINEIIKDVKVSDDQSEVNCDNLSESLLDTKSVVKDNLRREIECNEKSLPILSSIDSKTLNRSSFTDNAIDTTGEWGSPQQPIIQSMTTIMGSILSISNVDTLKQSKRSILADFKLTMRKSFDFSLWKKPIFILIVLTSIFGVPIYIYVLYLPALLAEFGGDPEDVPIFVCIIGGVDFVSRLAIGYFADTKYIKLRTIMVIAVFIAGANCQLITFYRTYIGQCVCVTIFGMFSSLYGTFLSVYITEMVGLNNLPKAVGFLQIMHGGVIAIVHPMIGFLKDVTGTYVNSYHFLGAMAILSSVILMTEPVFKKLEAKRNKRSETDEAENIL